MAAARKLKVYQATFGFYDSVVAAPNQAAALAAWGTRQNLFAEGQAKLTADPDAQAAALANPETPLRRPIGTSDAFSLAPDPPKGPSRPSTECRQAGAPSPTDEAETSAARSIQADRGRECGGEDRRQQGASGG